MNASITNLHLGQAPSSDEGSTAQLRRVRSLLSLFCLYTAALLAVILVSDGGDIGCILAGLTFHVFYATAKAAAGWRDAWHLDARLRLRRA